METKSEGRDESASVREGQGERVQCAGGAARERVLEVTLEVCHHGQNTQLTAVRHLICNTKKKKKKKKTCLVCVRAAGGRLRAAATGGPGGATCSQVVLESELPPLRSWAGDWSVANQNDAQEVQISPSSLV
ncbi:hypothetical protein E2C01_028966 [Portunus trituberculatus]|uniref:Uncharacterized protein n=1 Tax=Portunus trituberculatus TaxID=210409 RepID=A0A5B7EM35_PORTR|nr:hypothetical protein [Portunus trituberculatus]